VDHEAARAALLTALRRDADLHDQRRFEEIGSDFDRLDPAIPRASKDLMAALDFWDAWIDERNHRFPGFYPGIESSSWPVLARRIADDLVAGRAIGEPMVLKYFKPKPRESFLQRVWQYFRERSARSGKSGDSVSGRTV
jgi:hypothetical protein